LVTSELIGHLPIYGAMLVLLEYGSDRKTAALVPWLPKAARDANRIARRLVA
jgi:hypothetical protein